MGQWIHVYRKFTLSSNFQHFTESYFTLGLGITVPLNFSNFMRNHIENEDKWDKIVIHEFHIPHKWWKVKSHSHSIHANFVTTHYQYVKRKSSISWIQSSKFSSSSIKVGKSSEWNQKSIIQIFRNLVSSTFCTIHVW